MASSKSQASKSSDKRKRDKADQDEPAQKKKRKQGKAAKEDPADMPLESNHMDHVEDDPTNKEELEASVHNKALRHAKALQKWRISEPMGGRMSDIDPIFSADEEYVS